MDLPRASAVKLQCPSSAVCKQGFFNRIPIAGFTDLACRPCSICVATGDESTFRIKLRRRQGKIWEVSLMQMKELRARHGGHTQTRTLWACVKHRLNTFGRCPASLALHA